jgi:PKD repeat protein
MANNTSAEFRLAGFWGLYEPSGSFGLDLRITSLNRSGLQLSFTLLADRTGDGVLDASVRFQGCTTYIAMVTEHVFPRAENMTGTLGDFSNGTLRLLVNRTDSHDGLLRLHCGRGVNASVLAIPYGAPLRAYAGEDMQVRVDRTVYFNASGSRTADPSRTQYIWDFSSSDGLGTDATGINASHAYSAHGTYNVTLTLRLDSYSSNDTIKVVVSQNLPPVADAEQYKWGRKGIPVSFHGSGIDPDGTVVSYVWDFGDGTSAAGRNVTHAYNSSGNFSAVLVIRDDDGALANDSIGVHINFPPSITSLTRTAGGSRISFKAVASDPDVNDTLYYRWEFGDGETGTQAEPTHTYDRSGNFTVKCTVSDSWDDNATGSLNVSVTNLAPVIASMGVKSSAAVGQSIYFRPSAYDPEGDNLTFYWNFGDGTSNRSRSPSHSYSRADTYHVVLSVSDDQSTTTSSTSISIIETAPEPMAASSVLGLTCLAGFGMIVVVFIVYSISRTKTPQNPYSYTGYPGPPPGAPLPEYGVPQPYQGPPPPEVPTPRRAAVLGPCPRCGSADLTVFGDGHSKCNNCKKIIYTGR